MFATAFRRALRAFGAVVASATLASTALVLASPAGASTTWPTYHASPDRQGADTTEATLSPSTQAWRSTLDGAVYGQPLVANGRVYVATENDTVYALDAHDGHVLWQTSVGVPLHDVGAATGCGNIDPLGITSTPVIDPATGTLYVLGEVASGSGRGAVVHHQLVGMNPTTGVVGVSANADPPIGSVAPAGQSTVWLQQRGALAMANGRVYVAFGGLAGDCGIYHGWVVGVDAQAARPNVSFNTTPGGQGGAIWGPGGPAIDAAGNVYVSTGNPNSPQNPPVGFSESVVALAPDLGLLGSFRDALATDDADLATNGATVLPGGLVFAAGKTDIGYLLAGPTLTLVAAISGVCGGAPDGGNAYDASTNTLFVPCRSGSIQPVNLTTHAVRQAIGGVNGPPILADGHLWAVSYPGSSLYEIDPVTGAKVQTLSTGSAVTTFASPSAADGLILVGTMTGVTAFAGPGGAPPPAPGDPVTDYYIHLGGPGSYLGGPVDNVHAVPGGEVEDFANGLIAWSPTTGAHAVHGAIVGRYLALGGPVGLLRFPTTDETPTRDGIGRFNDFSGGGGGAIYWTYPTGAWSVHGAIRDHWSALGAERSVLGYPTSDETGTVDGVGRYNTFSGGGTGAMFWTPRTGPWSVHGAIFGHYLGLGGPTGVLGYPTSDETGSSDGVGRFNTFSGGGTGAMFWTPALGAWSVHGAIRDRWAALGAERGSLGYPTSDEYAIAGGRRNNFVTGTISWNAGSAAVTVTSH
ncbi:MAG: PQQ-binding-like beta-propeller repeat protein [Actinomycetota bacterium]|nr:PQQ-binding-like beta-propeller repeat protein [Actinomycetota bacterium]